MTTHNTPTTRGGPGPHGFTLRVVLAATDLSARSDRALRRAALLAQSRKARLVVLHAVDDDQPPSIVALGQKEAGRLLHQQMAGLAELGAVQPQPVVELGDAHQVVLHVAEAHGADLIVMGEHRRRPVRDWFAGTTAERVIRRGRRPVLAVHQPPAAPYRRVLIATDFSAHSERALQAALGLGLLDGAALTFLHAQEVPGARGMGLVHLPEDEARAVTQAATAEARAALAQCVEGLSLAQPPELLVEEGRAGAVIQHVVERLRPDLVVMGTAGAGQLRQAIIGSVAAEILGLSACDVLAVPPGDETPSPQRGD